MTSRLRRSRTIRIPGATRIWRSSRRVCGNERRTTRRERKMLKAGDVVTVDFQGATGNKRRPAVVLSSDAYHHQRRDVILGILTSNVAAATRVMDHPLSDWEAAGLRVPTAFRAYLGMALAAAVR